MNDSSRRRATSLLTSAVLFVLILLWAGCGETYRPIANPIPLPGGDPQATHYALVLNTNGGLPPTVNGPSPSATQLDVSGDTNLANHPVGQNPVHAVMSPAFGRAYVVNQGDSTLSSFSPLAGIGATVSTIPLIANNEPNAGASYVAASTSIAFVVETALNRVAVIDGNQLQISAFVPVGVNPVAVVCTRDGRKAYVSNQGSNTVSVISTKDNTNQKNIPVGSSPGAMAISSDNNYVFVANQGDGTVSVIDTNSDSEVLPNGARLQVGANPSQLVWDNGLKRLYTADTGSASVSIIDANSFPQKVLRTVATSASPVGVAALDNGTKFYVLFQGTPGFVEIYDAQGFYKRGTVTVGNNTLPNGLPMVNQTLLSAAPGSTKVYAVNYYGDSVNTGGSVSIIRTLDDTVFLSLPTPVSNPDFVTTQ
ncbi:MAG: beta-propeller fold lactonase family protein [Terriglobales bacterium]